MTIVKFCIQTTVIKYLGVMHATGSSSYELLLYGQNFPVIWKMHEPILQIRYGILLLTAEICNTNGLVACSPNVTESGIS